MATSVSELLYPCYFTLLYFTLGLGLAPLAHLLIADNDKWLYRVPYIVASAMESVERLGTEVVWFVSGVVRSLLTIFVDVGSLNFLPRRRRHVIVAVTRLDNTHASIRS